MKSITFRPLRLNNSGKIIVAAYPGWRKVKTADYGKFSLTVDDEYRKMNPDAFVYNHKGEQLFFPDYNPADLPILRGRFDYMKACKEHGNFAYTHTGSEIIHYHMKCADCDGVPCFSHYTADYIVSDPTRDYKSFEPLTVETVTKWFGWFLYQLENSSLQIGK